MMEGGLLVNGRPCQRQCRKQLTQEYPLHECCHSFGPSRHWAAKKHPWYADNSLRWLDLPLWTHSHCIISPGGPWYHLRALPRLNPVHAIKHRKALCGSVNLSMSSQLGSPGGKQTWTAHWSTVQYATIQQNMLERIWCIIDCLFKTENFSGIQLDNVYASHKIKEKSRKDIF